MRHAHVRHRGVFGVLAWLVAIGTATAAVSTAETKRLQAAAAVLRAIRDQPDKGVSEELWKHSQCVCRHSRRQEGGARDRRRVRARRHELPQRRPAGARPCSCKLAKGSWGLQFGAAEIDLVLLVLNRDGAGKLLNNKIALGADASIAGGPVGRAANAATDAQLRAEILSYSRARGVFAGIDISGGVLSPDKDANTDAYGANLDAKEIAFGNVPPPPETRPLLKELSRQTAATTGVK